MSAEEAWRTWWEAEGKHMKRLPHHNGMDHMASVTRIAWLNGAFGAADEIERLRAERDEARREICRRDHLLDTDWLNSPFPMQVSSPRMFADLYGWDCFKENA